PSHSSIMENATKVPAGCRQRKPKPNGGKTPLTDLGPEETLKIITSDEAINEFHETYASRRARFEAACAEAGLQVKNATKTADRKAA
ncbi:hypothetical protein ACFQXB_20230, partial [Plastorhodobacter daqingensis]